MGIFDWFVRLFTLGKGVVSLCFSVVFCAVLISLKPPQRVVFHDVMISTFLYPAQAILSRLNRTVFLSRENEELKRANTALRVQNDRLAEAIKQMPRVQELEAYGSMSGLRLKMAQIAAEDPGRYSTNWVINLGHEDSVDVNMVVLTSKGIVGRTAKCYRSHCLVQGLHDPNGKVSVLCARSRVNGMLESWPGGRLVARFPMDVDVHPGDTLVASGMGGVFPKGLQVGVITGENRDNDDFGDILRGLEVKPFQNPYLVEEVFVLIRPDRWVVGSEEPEAPSPYAKVPPVPASFPAASQGSAAAVSAVKPTVKPPTAAAKPPASAPKAIRKPVAMPVPAALPPPGDAAADSAPPAPAAGSPPASAPSPKTPPSQESPAPAGSEAAPAGADPDQSGGPAKDGAESAPGGGGPTP